MKDYGVERDQAHYHQDKTAEKHQIPADAMLIQEKGDLGGNKFHGNVLGWLKKITRHAAYIAQSAVDCKY